MEAIHRKEMERAGLEGKAEGTGMGQQRSRRQGQEGDGEVRQVRRTRRQMGGALPVAGQVKQSLRQTRKMNKHGACFVIHAPINMVFMCASQAMCLLLCHLLAGCVHQCKISDHQVYKGPCVQAAACFFSILQSSAKSLQLHAMETGLCGFWQP